MDKRIDFKGVTLSPNDYECNDDELAYCVNMVNEGGSLRAVKVPVPLARPVTLPPYMRLMCIHNIVSDSGATTHYIVYDARVGERNFRYFYFPPDVPAGAGVVIVGSDLGAGEEPREVRAVGNTLIISTNVAMYYALWKNNGYIWLGSELPELRVTPYLSTEMLNYDDFSKLYNVDNTVSTFEFGGSMTLIEQIVRASAEKTSIRLNISDENKAIIADSVFGAINQYVKELTKKGKFYAPFFVRLAWRLYDETTYARHTSPVLMMVNQEGKPHLFFYAQRHNDVVTNKIDLLPFMTAADLKLVFRELPDIDVWRDIISGVDVFVSEPLVGYTADMTGIDCFTNFSASQHTIGANAFDTSYREYNYYNGDFSQRNDFYLSLGADWRAQTIMVPSNIKRAGEFYADFSLVGQSLSVTFYVAYKYRGRRPDRVLIASPSGGTTVSDSAADTPDSIYEELGIDRAIYHLYKVTQTRVSYTYSGDHIRVFIEVYTQEPEFEFKVFQEFSMNDIDGQITLKRDDGKTMEELIKSTSVFHRIKKYDLKDLVAGEVVTVVPDNRCLQSLSVQPTLGDTGQMRSRVTGNYIYPYNNRINVAVDKKSLPYLDGLWSWQDEQDDPDPESATGEHIIRMAVRCTENGQRIKRLLTVGDTPSEVLYKYAFRWFSYPYGNVTDVVILTEKDDNGSPAFTSYTLTPTKHDTLNGVYAYNPAGLLQGEGTNYSGADAWETAVLQGYNDMATYGNMIYTSDVNNPFVFDEANAKGLQNNKIIALSSTTAALSEGQFGSFPMYAFTDNGVWALAVNGDGTFASPQPVSRDVILRADSLCQTDNAILFGTERGIMLLSGSQTQCITDVLNGRFFNFGKHGDSDYYMVYSGQSHSRELLYKLKALVMDATENSESDLLAMPKGEAKDFFAACSMVYDYANQRVVFYEPYDEWGSDYLPVMLHYSLDNKTWGMEQNRRWQYSLSDYPDTLISAAVNRQGNPHSVILTTAGAKERDADQMFVLSRPMKLDAPDVLKTMRQLVARGVFRRSDVKTVLYASRNLRDWHYVGSSGDCYLENYTGTPYKYFCVGCYIPAGTPKDISLSGVTMRFVTKDDNKMR